MAKFSAKPMRPNVTAAVKTTKARTRTYEGHLGYERDAKSALFLLACSNMVRENTFYEGAKERDDRFAQLAQDVTRDDPDWVAGFIPYLRDTMQMRSASLVLAAHYVAAGGANGRRVVASALSRADEPAELLAYWAQEYGRNFPQPVKRGVADACKRLYTERNALKYDGQSKAWRMGDVIDLTHPKPTADWQSDLFRWLLDTRHNRDEVSVPETLPMIRARVALEQTSPGERRSLLADPGLLAQAGLTWEALSGWLQGPMDAQAWEAVIPSMGYMALLRNLRNFEQAGVSGQTLDVVAARLADAESVAQSRQFPIRFYSAWKATGSTRFGWPLEQALEHSLSRVPSLPGRSLVLIDVSGSMHDRQSARSEIARWETAAVFGVAFSRAQQGRADTYIYNTGYGKLDNAASTLRAVDMIRQNVGGGTNTMQVLHATYQGHDRVLILTDEQAHRGPEIQLPCPLYTFNLAGYAPAQVEQGQKGSYVFGGLTDAGFSLLASLDGMRNGGWPW